MCLLEIFSDIITGYFKRLILNRPNQRDVPELQLQSETLCCNNMSANLRGFNSVQEQQMLLGQQQQTPHKASEQQREVCSGISTFSLHTRC